MGMGEKKKEVEEKNGSRIKKMLAKKLYFRLLSVRLNKKVVTFSLILYN